MRATQFQAAVVATITIALGIAAYTYLYSMVGKPDEEILEMEVHCLTLVANTLLYCFLVREVPQFSS